MVGSRESKGSRSSEIVCDREIMGPMDHHAIYLSRRLNRSDTALESLRRTWSTPQSKSSTPNISRTRKLVRNVGNFAKRVRRNGLSKQLTERQLSPNRVVTATLASRLFFHQLNGHVYSPSVVKRVVAKKGFAKSYKSASKMLSLLTDIEISQYQINNLMVSTDAELRHDCDE